MTPLTVATSDKELIQEAVNKHIAKAEKFFDKKMAPITEIQYKHNLGTTAGWCCTKFADRSSTLKFNTVLLNENKSEFIRRTVAHEVAHHIVYSVYGWAIYGKKVMPHGKHFKYVMSAVLGIQDVTSCHSYDTSTASTLKRTRTVARPYKYKCNCRTHSVTSNIHNKMVRGQGRICSSCRGSLVRA